MRKKLIEQRKQHLLTQFELAKQLGISEVYVRKLERGSRNPSIALMIKFEEFFGLPMKELFPDIFLKVNDTECIKKLA
ncbi:helix-turn-helix transcriptional regulator [Solibacillus sp. MA9]|uniref:Helix-turn-helix transcriptional regulator n=1 Tax=Solibacillus palustris TaxID=2908203 RepID=A0ABS9UCL4_9BACL|nr:helix-turn-helix transcriptional regulator [Solibacillus sp. MA9]MCH7321745.1 helix-turn-helix transcriptional regulator [Solibacillus sp. MA9]